MYRSINSLEMVVCCVTLALTVPQCVCNIITQIVVCCVALALTVPQCVCNIVTQMVVCCVALALTAPMCLQYIVTQNSLLRPTTGRGNYCPGVNCRARISQRQQLVAVLHRVSPPVFIIITQYISP